MRWEHWIYTIPLRLKSLFRRDQAERELAEEMQYHVDRKVEELIASGITPNDARLTAFREMGGLEQQKELCRDARHVGLIEDLIQDLRYGVRTLKKTPILTAVVILSLALGIGANTAIFGVMNAVLLQLLPVPDPDQLVLLNWSSKGWPDSYLDDIEGGDFRDTSTGLVLVGSSSVSSDTYEYIKSHNTVLDAAVAFAANDDQVNVGLNGHAESANIQSVSGNYFEGLRVAPFLGRVMTSSDDSISSPTVAVASYNFWKRKLGSDPSIVGKTLALNGVAVTVVGVAPPEFFGLEPGSLPDMWVPLSFKITQSLRNRDNELRAPRTWWLGVVGRLRPGVSRAQARAELEVLFRQSLVKPTEANAVPPALVLVDARKGLNDLRERFSAALWILMSMVGLVLLIACANVAGLLLARATARQREIAIRVSLGAARRRVIRQLLTESVLLAIVGGLAGLVVAKWGSAALVSLLASGRSPIYLFVQTDYRVLFFTVLISVLSGILFGLAPAIGLVRVDVLPALKQTVATSGGPRFRAGRFLVSAQLALCVLLVVGAGLMIRTLQQLKHIDFGFQREKLVVFTVAPGLNGYSGDRLAGYYEELKRRIEGVPGVRSVTLSQQLAVGGGTTSGEATILGSSQPVQDVKVFRHYVSSDYFNTLRIPIILGRPIESSDLPTPIIAVVVNRAFVHQYLHDENPIGRNLSWGGKRDPVMGQIVGLAGDVRYGRIRDNPPPTLYLSYRQRQLMTQMSYQVSTTADPRAVMAAIRSESLALDKNVPVVGLKTQTDVIDQALYLERTFAVLSTAFAVLALVLACVGLYGTIGYIVAQRTTEFGIRMALGAQRANIVHVVLRDTLIVIGAGLLVGLPIAWIGTRLLKNQLFGLSPHDPATLAVAAIAIVAAALAAGFLPARRASRVDPMVALRYE